MVNSLWVFQQHSRSLAWKGKGFSSGFLPACGTNIESTPRALVLSKTGALNRTTTFHYRSTFLTPTYVSCPAARAHIPPISCPNMPINPPACGGLMPNCTSPIRSRSCNTHINTHNSSSRRESWGGHEYSSKHEHWAVGGSAATATLALDRDEMTSTT